MPFFDAEMIEGNPNLSVEYLRDLNTVIAKLEGRRVDFLQVRGADRLANLIRAYMQAHIRRSLEFLESARAELNAGRRLVVMSCLRAIYENIAVFCDFEQRIKLLIEAGDLEAIRKFVDGRSFSTRLDELIAEHGEEVRSINILTLIDKMVLKFEDFRKMYEHVCEFVHPNSLGTVIYFIELRDDLVYFQPLGRDPQATRRELLAGAFLLTFVEIAAENIERMLETLPSAASAGNL